MAGDDNTASPPPRHNPTSTARRSSASGHIDGFSCSICGRTYKAKETLNRHSNIHTTEFKHVCSDCGIGFYRKDLLARHSKLHEPRDDARGQTKGRQRSQRACDHCRARRMKCDSKIPCSACSKSRRECSYARKSDRLSQRNARPASKDPGSSNSRRDESPAASGEEIREAYQVQDTTNGVTQQDDGDVVNIISMPYGNDSNVEESSAPFENKTIDGLHGPQLEGSLLVGFDSHEAGLQLDSEMANPEFTAFVQSTWVSGTPFQPQSWPWLYEDKFLQRSPNLDWELFNMYDDTFNAPSSNPTHFLSQMTTFNTPRAFQENAPATSQCPSMWPISNSTDHVSTASGASEENHNMFGNHMTLNPNFHTEDLFCTTGTPKQCPRASKFEAATPKLVSCDDLVEELISFAFQSLSDAPRNDQRPIPVFWKDMAPQVELVFGLTELTATPSLASPPMHILHCFVQLYFHNFHPLWTLLWTQGLNLDEIPPHLYLTLSSIGAMYAGKHGATYGSMMHEHLCRALTTTPMWFNHPDEMSETLLQSMVLTLLSALYFGQKRAFTIGQQIACLMVTLARKINLFTDDFPLIASWDKRNLSGPEQQYLLSWRIRAETRRKLAFGMHRTELFLSVMMNTRPLISPEEMNLEMPSASTLWEYNTHDKQRYLMDVEVNQKHKRRLLFSDLVRIATDRSEPLPVLNPAESEMLLFALQLAVWRFSHDRTFFQRLTGNEFVESSAASIVQNDFFDGQPDYSSSLEEFRESITWGVFQSPPPQDVRDHLDCSLRQMRDLQTDHARALSALRKWKANSSASATPAQLTSDRSVLVSGRLVYHLSFIRLKSDVSTFNVIPYYSNTTTSTQEQEAIANVHKWSKTKNAQDALAHACAIWSLVSKETSRSEDSRARFTLMGPLCLHHAASVVWAYAGTHASPGKAALNMGDTTVGARSADLRIYRSNNSVLLTSFTELLQKATPAWIAMSAFATTIANMAETPFPR